MKDRKNSRKLYNVIVPLWMLILFPTTWVMVLPGNFLIDSLVLFIALKIMNTENKWSFYKKHILKIFVFGMISDFFGAGLLLLAAILEISVTCDELYLTLPAMLISCAMIFALNYFITFKKSDKREKLKLSLSFAIATAPYTFLIPVSWLY